MNERPRVVRGLVGGAGHPGSEGRSHDNCTDLRRGRSASRREAGEETTQPVERGNRQKLECATPDPKRAAASWAGAQVSLERAPLVSIERPRHEALHRDTIEPVAEDELLRKSVSRHEERLLDLRRGETELGCRLVDAEPVQLTQHIDAALPLGQRRQRGHQFARALDRLPTARRAFRQLGGRQLTPPHDEVDRTVVRDPEEPRLDAVGHAPVAQCAIRLQESRLRDVVTGRCVAEQVRAVGGQTVHIPPVQLVERSCLAGGEAVAELFVREASQQQRAHVSSTGEAGPADWPGRRHLLRRCASVTDQGRP